MENRVPPKFARQEGRRREKVAIPVLIKADEGQQLLLEALAKAHGRWWVTFFLRKIILSPEDASGYCPFNRFFGLDCDFGLIHDGNLHETL